MVRVSSNMIAAGAGLLACGGAAYLLSTSLFAAPALPSWVNRIGFVCVFGYWVPVLVGLTLLIFGLILRQKGE
jgi:hypothetical protein